MLSDSRFAMWRGLVALVHADHRVTKDEVDFFVKRLDKIEATQTQKETLLKDLEYKQDVAPFIEEMTDSTDRSNFVYFGRLVFYSDGDFAKQEACLLNLIHDKVMSKVDLENVMHDVDQNVADYMAAFDQERQERKENLGFLQRFIDKISGDK